MGKLKSQNVKKSKRQNAEPPKSQRVKIETQKLGRLVALNSGGPAIL